MQLSTESTETSLNRGLRPRKPSETARSALCVPDSAMTASSEKTFQVLTTCMNSLHLSKMLGQVPEVKVQALLKVRKTQPALGPCVSMTRNLLAGVNPRSFRVNVSS